MAFKSTVINLGARRAQLTSKEGGVSFYKGTGSHPALGPKSQGSHGTGRVNGRIYRLDPLKMRSFIVPDQVLNFKQLLIRSDLRPYTESNLNLPIQIDNDRFPIDRRKKGKDDDDSNDNKRSKKKKKLASWFNSDSIYSHKGFDGDYFRQLMNHLRDKRSVKRLEST